MSLHLPRHLRNRHLFILDAVLLALCTLVAYVVRFEGFDWGPAHLYTGLVYIAVSVPLKLGVLLYVGLYRRLWRFAGVAELEHILVATAISASISGLVGAALLPGLGITPYRVPLSVLFIDACLGAGAVALPRLFIRLLGRRTQWRRLEAARRVLIVGAGAAGPTTSPPAPPANRVQMRAQLEPKAWAGKASVDELKTLRAICSYMGDRACRDRASAMLKAQAPSSSSP
jgi:FlaA1/EpsC-like NDP-sugar epimerase